MPLSSPRSCSSVGSARGSKANKISPRPSNRDPLPDTLVQDEGRELAVVNGTAAEAPGGGGNTSDVGMGPLRQANRETIASMVKQEVSQMSSFISERVVSAIQEENASLLDFCRNHADQVDVRQTELVRQQSMFMKTLVGHIGRLTEAISNLESNPRLGPNGINDAALKHIPPTVFMQEPNGAMGNDVDVLRDCTETTFRRNVDQTQVNNKSMQSASDDTSRFLEVTIVSGTNLKSTNPNKVTPTDAYCRCWIPGKVPSERSAFETPVLQETMDPQWDHTAVLTDYSAGDSLRFKVMDQENFAEDAYIGEVSVDQAAIEQPGGFEGDLPLKPNEQGDGPTLRVKVQVLEGTAPTIPSRPPRSPTSLNRAAGHAQRVVDAIDADTSATDMIMRELKHKQSLSVIKKLPTKLQGPGLRWLDYMDSLHEPERTRELDKAVDGKVFFTVSLLFVLIDQVVTVIATNYSARNYLAVADAGLPLVYKILDRILLAWFALELLLKIMVHRLYFFIGDQCKMNLLDFFLVAYSFIEAIGIDLSFLRALRVFKLAKVIRMLKALSQVRDLRIMMDCLISSGFALFWAGVLVMFLTYMFALVFVQAMTDYMISNKDTLTADEAGRIADKFGSVEQGILSLTMSLTGGFDWIEIYNLVIVAGTLGRFACLFFVILFTISVWNIVSSIFVEKVMSVARPNQREVIEQLQLQDFVDAGELKAFFLKFDEDRTGSLDREEFLKLCREGGLKDFMSVRELKFLDAIDAEAFFEMAKHLFSISHACVDERSIEAIPFDSLVTTFLKVKGNATGLDIAVCKNEIERKLDKITDAVSKLAFALNDQTTEI